MCKTVLMIMMNVFMVCVSISYEKIVLKCNGVKLVSDENHQRLTASNDFFSLSTLRDLIFHVQEHRFTLLQIKDCLDELGLKFCGFENKEVISKFREAHGQEVDICDLVLWNEFEEKNPRSFAGMYQFWCQKQ